MYHRWTEKMKYGLKPIYTVDTYPNSKRPSMNCVKDKENHHNLRMDKMESGNWRHKYCTIYMTLENKIGKKTTSRIQMWNVVSIRIARILYELR